MLFEMLKKRKKKKKKNVKNFVEIQKIIHQTGVMNNIFTFLDGGDLLNVEFVCKKFRDIVEGITMKEDWVYIINNTQTDLLKLFIYSLYYSGGCNICRLKKRGARPQCCVYESDECLDSMEMICSGVNCICEVDSCWNCSSSFCCYKCKPNNMCRLEKCNKWVCENCVNGSSKDYILKYGFICPNHMKKHCK